MRLYYGGNKAPNHSGAEDVTHRGAVGGGAARTPQRPLAPWGPSPLEAAAIRHATSKYVRGEGQSFETGMPRAGDDIVVASAPTRRSASGPYGLALHHEYVAFLRTMQRAPYSPRL